MLDKVKNKEATICVVGMGYVGLPLSMAFSGKGFKTIGYDVDSKKIENLRKGINSTAEFEASELKNRLSSGITFTTDPSSIREADIIHICVPTLLNSSKEPDMGHIESASKTIGQNLKKGAVVINESSVYPGATEEVIKPILEKESGMACGRDFKLGFSPERVNPGDKEHNLRGVVKVVSGIDEETTEILAELYENIVDAGVFKARNIKTAEMAKLSENIQRDLNIAMINELSIISRKMGIDIMDVLEAAGTKWNFNKYYPGLVGGYCVPVNPLYLLHKSKQLGYEPKVIAAGRELNDSMPDYIANMVSERFGRGSRVLVMGLGFKKNIKDSRESPAKGLIGKLKERGFEIFCYDPLLKKEDVAREFGIEPVYDLKDLSGIDCILVAVGHDAFKEVKTDELKSITSDKPIMIDIQSFFDKDDMKRAGFEYVRL